MAKESGDEFQVVSYPRMQRLVTDIQKIAHRQHTVHGLLEVDVTRARQYIREHKANTGETLSFTAFVTACLGRAVDMNKRMQSVLNWRSQLVERVIQAGYRGHKTSLRCVLGTTVRRCARSGWESGGSLRGISVID